MSIHIDNHDRLHHEGSGLALHCPCCQVFSHLTPASVPQFAALTNHRPTQIGIVYRCDSCTAPVFIKYQVKSYAADHIELGGNYTELERVRERFSFTYLPEQCEQLFREALNCYSNGCYIAFVLLCRRVVQLVIKHFGDSGRLKVFDMLVEIRDIAEIDNDYFAIVKQAVFDRETDAAPPPALDGQRAGIVLEVMKDLLYQCYVRRGKLQKAMRVRRYFADERSQNTAMAAVRTSET